MTTKLMIFVWSMAVVASAQQQRPVPPAFARSTNGRAVAPLDLEPNQQVPQPFRRVSLPLYRGRGFSLEAQEPKPAPAGLVQQQQQQQQQTFQPRPVENGNEFSRVGGNNNEDEEDAPQLGRQTQQQQQQVDRAQQQQVDRVQQQQVDRVQQQQVDRVQQQPEKPFLSFRPQPQIQPIETQPHFIKKVVQRPLKRVQVTEDATTSRSAETIQKLKLERSGSAEKQRAKKPVSQVLRRYRDDNPDGSITWGFENDDGTFKEETIGVDCVTRGKYGYVDPEGVKREYSYQSGIPCDKNRKPLQQQESAGGEPSSAVQEAQASDSYGYIDYTKNQYVMANGQTINLNGMAKNRARKPVRKTPAAVASSTTSPAAAAQEFYRN